MVTISQDIFRAYDIRGIVDESLTPEVVYDIARAIGSEAQACQQKQIIIARDGRLSGPALSQSLKEGLLATGCDVIDIGAVPTPLLYFATYELSSRSGVMLTGSHNPKNYNGLKMVIAGETLSEERIQKLYTRIISGDLLSGRGHYSQENIIEKYISHVTQTIKLLRPLKIVVDAGNGIAGSIAPQLYRALGCEVHSLFCEVDGHFPHHHPDPSDPVNLESLIREVKHQKAEVGLAFDGDGDRLGVVTNKGEVIWPDRQLMLYAKDVLSRNPGAKIIFDVKCTQHLSCMIEKFGGEPLMWKTGHSFIKQKMKEETALLAGEMSGHVFFKERWYGFDDGLYTGARLLEILSNDVRTSSEIFEGFPNSVNTPELKLAIEPHQRQRLLAELHSSELFKEEKLITLDGIRVEFSGGFGLMRASNTTPYLTFRFEAKDEAMLKIIQEKFKRALLNIDPTLALPF